MSPFAEAVRALLDDTHLFDRDLWGLVLDVPTTSLESWVTDIHLPRPDLLRMILDILRNLSGVPQEPIAAFDALAQQPAQDISPLGRVMSPTVNDFMLGARLSRIYRAVRDKPVSTQLDLLRAGIWPA